MPWKSSKPSALDFDPNVPVCVRPAFKPKLFFSLFTFKLRRKSAHQDASCESVLHCFHTPMSISILAQPCDGMLDQPLDRIDMAPVKSPDRVTFNHGYRSDRSFIGSDIETEDSVPHFYNYH
jgi:hypothetical protein